jgi:hypothetical protein
MGMHGSLRHDAEMTGLSAGHKHSPNFRHKCVFAPCRDGLAWQRARGRIASVPTRGRIASALARAASLRHRAPRIPRRYEWHAVSSPTPVFKRASTILCHRPHLPGPISLLSATPIATSRSRNAMGKKRNDHEASSSLVKEENPQI